MNVTLHRKQRVSVGSRIRFHHKADSGHKHEVILNKRQFTNFDDIILNLDNYPSVYYFPLGGGIWLYRKNTTVKLIDNHRQSFFWFYWKAWRYYNSRVHSSIYKYLHNGQSYHYQYDEKYESESNNSFGGSPARLSPSYKTLSRSTRNACYENDKRTQLANVSRGKGADPRPCVRRSSKQHVPRIHRKIEADRDNATFSSLENDYIESCDECSVGEESDCSEQDQID